MGQVMGEIEYNITAERRLAILQILTQPGAEFMSWEDLFETADRILNYVETGEYYLPDKNEAPQ
jgi:hypothetical protein